MVFLPVSHSNTSWLSWRLFDPWGRQVFGPVNFSDVDVFQLDVAGTYTLLAEPRVWTTQYYSSVSYSFVLQEAAAVDDLTGGDGDQLVPAGADHARHHRVAAEAQAVDLARQGEAAHELDVLALIGQRDGDVLRGAVPEHADADLGEGAGGGAAQAVVRVDDDLVGGAVLRELGAELAPGDAAGGPYLHAVLSSIQGWFGAGDSAAKPAPP